MTRRLQQFDSSVDDVAARFRGNRILDRSFYALSESANHSILWHGINAVDATIGGPTRRRRALRRSVILGVEQALVNGLFKSIFRRQRPQPLTNSPHRLRTPRTTSFPSGHASAGACAATLLSKDLRRAPVWWSAAGLVSVSRIYVGVHHATDIAGGLVIGRLLARVAERIWPPIPDAATGSTSGSRTVGTDTTRPLVGPRR